MPRLEFREVASTTYSRFSWLVCDRYFYVHPPHAEWNRFPDIERCQKALGLEPCRLPVDLLIRLRQMVKDDQGEEAYTELVAAKLRGDA